jgi:hydrogenase maturation protein HypF
LQFIHENTRLLTQRLYLQIQGAVQGVGFRPFIYCLAHDLGLTGWVNNSAQGVAIEIEGSQIALNLFLLRLEQEKPPRSQIHNLNTTILEPIGYSNFTIRESTNGKKTAIVLPDLATCLDCLQELCDPTNRRYRYPLINCTHCGPRFSIIQSLPYDRPNTTMQAFEQCAACKTEYTNPNDRRFHAQPNACPQCGPQLVLWDREGKVLATQNDALPLSTMAIRQGKILAVKGLGGFHLMIDACNTTAVQRLRQLKRRPAKPFALMYPSLNLVKAHCEVSGLEEKLLRSPEAPIVLLRRKPFAHDDLLLCSSVAPDNPYLGIMLPSTPLHHLLMAELKTPIVATSGNLAGEPICAHEIEALQRLGTIADAFLVHNRAIAHPIDDSVVRVVMNRPMVLRRARGYAPLPILLVTPAPGILAVGAHLKNAIAFSIEQQAFVSQHIGDLETAPALEAFQHRVASFQNLYDQKPIAIACDLHPDYASTRWAEQSGLPVISVQHHYAHALSCMAENQIEGSVLAIAWDGTGYGLDGTLWGGEFLHVTETSFQRVAHLRTFRLPGGDLAIKEPRRAALGLLYEHFGEKLFDMRSLAPLQAFSEPELRLLKVALQRHLNAPITSSVGRLFDAIASILNLRQKSQFEGQAAMELEFASAEIETDEYYPFDVLESIPAREGSAIEIDWAATLQGILKDREVAKSVPVISAKFHNTLVEMIVTVARRVKEQQVVLTGGCFQNKYLLEKAIARLQAERFYPYWHQQIPPNDGGIALGQIVAASRNMQAQETNPEHLNF